MFEVLVFLVDNYFDGESCPDPELLELKLKAAGFDGEEIGDALEWLAGLEASGVTCLPAGFAERSSFRAYAYEEQRRLDRECRGFLEFLESAGVIDPEQREIIIERALALPTGEVDIAKLKIMTLIVLWSMGAAPDALVFDELLPDGEERAFH